MRIVVPIQQVFDPKQIRVSTQGRVVTEGAQRLIEPAGKAALEEALRLKDTLGAEVVVIALGEADVEESLREAQAMGADHAYLLSDSALAGGDAGATAYALSVGMQRIGGFDLVIAGEGGAIAGPMLAEFLGVPQITGACNVQIDANSRVVVQQDWDDGVRRVVAPLPALVTVPVTANSPRYPHAARVMAVFSEPTLTIWTAGDLGLDVGQVGSEAAQTQVRRTALPESRALGEKLGGTPEEQAKSLVGKLRSKGLI